MKNIILNISGMHCASCVSTIEGALKKSAGVIRAQVNLVSEKAYIEFDPEKIKAQDLLVAVEKSGYKAGVWEGELFDRERGLRDKEVKGLRIRFTASIILSSLLMYISMGPCIGLGIHQLVMKNMPLIQFILASAVLACGYQFFSRGLMAFIQARRANMDTLVALGVGSAYLYSLYVSIAIWLGNRSFGMNNLYYEVAAFLLSFILLGKYLEAITKRKTSKAIKRLLSLRPKTAIVIRGTKEIELGVEELVVGDVVMVKPGARIPVDGLVIEGDSSVDESLMTGESLPVEKTLNSSVIGGSINRSGTFKFKATKVGRESALYQIIRLVEDAQGSKAPVQEFADKIAAVFVPLVLVIALGSFLVWILLGKSFVFALSTFISVLIIACPCSLGLATPTAVMVATGEAAQNGIIIKNAAALQVAQDLKVIIFDKTGTLTVGKPNLTDIISYSASPEEVLRLAASVENESEHVLAEAIVNAAREKHISLYKVERFGALAGKGVTAKIGASEIMLGNNKLMQDNKIDTRIFESDLARLENEGKSAVFIVKDGSPVGLIAARDTLKGTAREVITRLSTMNKEVIMITGDNRRTAESICRELGIERNLSEVLPKEKLEEIKKLQARGAKVAFVGDGINDAPALTQADLGIAVGSGTDVAVESGDIILIKDDLRDVILALDLSRYAMRKIKQNLFFSFLYNVLGIPIAAGVLYPLTGFLLNPVISGLAMAFSSVSVVTNSLLMRRYKRTEV